MVGKLWVVCGAVLAAVAVVTGAMGTHLLKERLHVSQAELETFEVAVRYQMYHSFAIILVGLLAGRADGCALRRAVRLAADGHQAAGTRGADWRHRLDHRLAGTGLGGPEIDAPKDLIGLSPRGAPGRLGADAGVLVGS